MVTDTKVKQFAEVAEREYDHEVYRSVLAPAALSGLIPLERAMSSSLGPAVPDELLLGALRDGRLRVRSPISVKLSRENDDFVAEADEFNEFGFGKSSSEAIVDLQRAVAELYLTLETESRRLGPDLLAVWSTLRAKVEKVHDNQGT